MKILPHVALIAALALGVAGCSDDAEPSSGPTSEPTTSEPTTTEPTIADPSTSDAPTPSETATPTPDPTPSETVPPPPPEPTADPDAAPTTYDAALARFDAKGQEPRDLSRFETRSGIYCLLDSDFAIGCELPRGGIPDPAYCGDGPTENVGRVVLGQRGPVAECNSDTIREPDAPRVGRDTVAASSATGIQCLVEAIGVTCIDPARTHGFFLGKSEYTVFTAG